MIYDSLLNFMTDYCRHIHTIKPAIVTKVDLNKNTLSAKILTSTLYKDGDTSNFPDVMDVPFMILSGQKGLARITVPIAAGDNVVILFSDRDLAGLMSSGGSSVQKPTQIKTQGYYPVLALPSFFTASNAKTIEPDKIVIENGVTSIKVSATGEVEVIAPTTTTITTPLLTVNCPATVFTGTIAMTGIIPLEGATEVAMTGTIRHDGSYILNDVPMETHTHVEQGDGNEVGPPIAP